ncbi:ABC transporter substrate-binding protein [Roseomonas sp. GC11]|uniref:ABC transporter substrate-binding protein n=1 Tax=Roseomonas sp. GC11 TaxID=2950546 RepID=UPI00210D0B0B|nr:ABC transporter substrate-binding protein [Roseomonas sp. GC11]MCQ4160764.1 ABC transporter substrate-binding protein [Roseomonas sp. GC11]
MKRRSLLAGAAAGAGLGALPRFAVAQPAQNRVLKFVPQANLTSLDPIWTTATVTRNHGYMVYDCLYGTDEDFAPQPQMAEGASFEEGNRRVTITLRSGLKFHDGEPVRAADVVASLARWMKRSPMGQKLESFTDELAALDDRRLVFRLKRPFPRLLHALGSAASPAPVIMPERLAKTDPFQQVKEAIGSGPFRFRADEYNSGSFMAWERNPDYSPTPVGRPSLTAGPKRVHFDRIEWHIITDPSTAAAALQNGEMDWVEQPPPELLPLLRRNRALAVEKMDPRPNVAILRFNHLHPPFDNPAIRRAMLPAISQADFMVAIVGPEPSEWVENVGIFTPGTPFASEGGLAPLQGPRSVERARALLREAGYTNQTVRLIGPTDILAPTAMTQVCADLYRRLGLNLDVVLTDWGTTVQRRTSREPVEKGGWSTVLTSFSSFEFADPAGHFPLRGNGLGGWPGWPTSPRLEALRDAWFEAGDVAEQKRLAAEMQVVAMEELPFVPVGAYYNSTGLKRNLVDRVPGFALFWNLRRA